MLKTKLRSLVLDTPVLKKIYTKLRASRKNTDFIPVNEVSAFLDKATKVFLTTKNTENLFIGLVKGRSQYTGYIKERDYYPKYERFLKSNNIAYEYFDPYASDWIEKAKKFDLIIWHTESDPATQMHAEGKVYTLQNLLNVKVFPTFNELWGYENKINSHYQYKAFGLPEIPTFVSHSKLDAIKYVEQCRFPIISKIATGSSSYGVEKIKSKRQALKLINDVFSYKGRKTYFPYFAQKDYVYFQEFIETAEYDLRVISIGDKLLGYYRYPNKGDFRASGAGNYEKKEIPLEALKLAYQTKEAFGATCLATDMVFCKERNQFLIIESSIFIGVDTCEQLVIDGVPGVYIRRAENDYAFEPGRYWIQELALKEFIENNFVS